MCRSLEGREQFARPRVKMQLKRVDAIVPFSRPFVPPYTLLWVEIKNYTETYTETVSSRVFVIVNFGKLQRDIPHNDVFMRIPLEYFRAKNQRSNSPIRMINMRNISSFKHSIFTNYPPHRWQTESINGCGLCAKSWLEDGRLIESPTRGVA